MKIFHSIVTLRLPPKDLRQTTTAEVALPGIEKKLWKRKRRNRWNLVRKLTTIQSKNSFFK